MTMGQGRRNAVRKSARLVNPLLPWRNREAIGDQELVACVAAGERA
jgi:hypothetical protein